MTQKPGESRIQSGVAVESDLELRDDLRFRTEFFLVWLDRLTRELTEISERLRNPNLRRR